MGLRPPRPGYEPRYPCPKCLGVVYIVSFRYSSRSRGDVAYGRPCDECRPGIAILRGMNERAAKRRQNWKERGPATEEEKGWVAASEFHEDEAEREAIRDEQQGQLDYPARPDDGVPL